MYDFNNCHLLGIFCLIGSFSPHAGKSFTHVNVEKTEITKIITLQISAIHNRIQFARKRFIKVATKTIPKKTKFTNQICMYHHIKLFSSSEKEEFDFILFFTNGAKNIIPAIAESLASDDMMFFVVSICKCINKYL